MFVKYGSIYNFSFSKCRKNRTRLNKCSPLIGNFPNQNPKGSTSAISNYQQFYGPIGHTHQTIIRHTIVPITFFVLDKDVPSEDMYVARVNVVATQPHEIYSKPLCYKVCRDWMLQTDICHI